MRDFSDALFEDIAGYGSSLDWDFWYDLFDESAPAAMYAAREIVYSLVGDAETAKKLSDWGADLELDEQDALDSLIADALEAANEHEAMMDYYHNPGLRITISNKVDAKNKELIDKELANASDDDKHQILFNAINSLVLNGCLSEGVKGNPKEDKLAESGMPSYPKRDINEVQKEIREYISKGMYQSAASDIFEYGIIDAYGNKWNNFSWNGITANVKNSDITLFKVFNDYPEFKALVEANTGKLILETVTAHNMALNNITIHLHVAIFNTLTTKSQALEEVNNKLKAEKAPEQPKPTAEPEPEAKKDNDLTSDDLNKVISDFNSAISDLDF